MTMIRSRSTWTSAATCGLGALFLLVAGCATSTVQTDDGGVDAATDGSTSDGGSCGLDTCASGQLCCPGCSPSQVFCAAPDGPGGACPLLGCPVMTCGGEVCVAGDACCTDCDGNQSCSAGGACPGGPCPPPSCGGDVCGPGQLCCTNDCDGSQFCEGTGACPIFECPIPGPCVAQDAQGDGGPCDGFFGYAWNGSSCEGITGCSCVGTDCGSTYMDLGACRDAHAACAGAFCGGFGGVACGAMQYCLYDSAGGASCGADDGGGVCTPRPAACPSLFDPVCGCDGADYVNDCVAHAAGTDVSSYGTCAAPVTDCRTTGCAAGESCIVCGPPGTGYSCIPDGTLCGL